MSSKFFFTLPGTVVGYPWVNKPDTKFNDLGIFKLDLALTGEAAASLRSKIDAEVERVFEEQTRELSPKDKKAYTISRPYEVEEDDEGKPTGRTIFTFKQNHTIKLKDGTTKKIWITLKDATGTNDTHERVSAGAEAVVCYSMRGFKQPSNKTVSLRLDFAAVQIIKLGQGGSGGITFKAQEGGFVDEGDHAPADTSTSEPSDDEPSY